MKKFCWIMLLLLIPSFTMGRTKTINGQATGRYYNDVWKQWVSYPIKVYVGDDGNAYINAGESLQRARGVLYPEEIDQVISLLEKGVQWAEVARKEKMEVTKELGSFMKGVGFERYGVELTFFAANAGSQTDVILHVIDFDNPLYNITLYIDPEQVAQLITLLKLVPMAVQDLTRQEEQAKKLDGIGTTTTEQPQKPALPEEGAITHYTYPENSPKVMFVVPTGWSVRPNEQGLIISPPDPSVLALTVRQITPQNTTMYVISLGIAEASFDQFPVYQKDVHTILTSFQPYKEDTE